MPYAISKERCCPWFDKLTMRSQPLKALGLILSNHNKLTMRFKPLITLDLILSLSKDEATFAGFLSIPLSRLHLGEIQPARGFELRLDRLARQLTVRPEIVVESRHRVQQRFLQLLDRALQDLAEFLRALQ